MSSFNSMFFLKSARAGQLSCLLAAITCQLGCDPSPFDKTTRAKSEEVKPALRTREEFEKTMKMVEDLVEKDATASEKNAEPASPGIEPKTGLMNAESPALSVGSAGIANGAQNETAKAVPDANQPAVAAVLPKISEDAFLQAAMNGDEPTVKRGVRQGIRLTATAEDKRTALMLAAFDGHNSIVAYLIEHKADVNARDLNQRTALMYAASGPNAETVRLLADAGSDVNAIDGEENWTPLMFAAAEGHVEVVKILLAHGAKVESKDVDGETALQFAQSKGHTQVAELLTK
ncbi:MAG: ankyrin repeat domain-containing protein [Pirellulaceae bacterium]|nr:ankyrin repeat domain-containing protein [Pirellulaceae bacterium]